MNSKSIIGFLVLVILFPNCSKDDNSNPAPFSVTMLSPSSGQEGMAVEIVGAGFSDRSQDNVVKFNGVVATVTSATTSTLDVTVPDGATTGSVTVTIGDYTVEGPAFTVTVPTITKSFYVKFKANGVVKVFEEENPGYQSCGQCACSYVPVLNDARSASIVVCNNAPNWITAADIEGWSGDKLAVHATGFPTAALEFTQDDVFYSSDNVVNQTASEVNITSVVADGTFNTKKAFKVSGNFKCTVAQSDGSNIMAITDGTFVLRYTED